MIVCDDKKHSLAKVIKVVLLYVATLNRRDCSRKGSICVYLPAYIDER